MGIQWQQIETDGLTPSHAFDTGTLKIVITGYRLHSLVQGTPTAHGGFHGDAGGLSRVKAEHGTALADDFRRFAAHMDDSLPDLTVDGSVVHLQGYQSAATEKNRMATEAGLLARIQLGDQPVLSLLLGCLQRGSQQRSQYHNRQPGTPLTHVLTAPH